MIDRVRNEAGRAQLKPPIVSASHLVPPSLETLSPPELTEGLVQHISQTIGESRVERARSEVSSIAHNRTLPEARAGLKILRLYISSSLSSFR
jgi:hypothetical protein